MILKKLALAALLFFCFELFVYCQVNNGIIAGVVLDGQNARVKGVTIIVNNFNNELIKEVISNENGVYTISNLIPGKYKLLIQPKEYESQEINLNVRANVTSLINIELQLNKFIDIIEVKSNKIGNVKEDVKLINDLTMEQNLSSFIIRSKIPEYPKEAIQKGDIGDIFIGVVVNGEGKVDYTFYLKGNLSFRESAKQAIEQWQFLKSKNGLLGYVRIRYNILNDVYTESKTVGSRNNNINANGKNESIKAEVKIIK